MDIDLARTFIAVAETGNFNKAADQINVSQSTISTRVKALEDSLGQTLFVRNKNGTVMTGAGANFQKYAVALIRTWEQARQETALPQNFRGILSIGGQFTLWERLLLKWIPWMRKAVPDLAIKAEVGLSDGLMRLLLDGMIDIGVMYNPLSRPGLVIEELLTEKLVLVSTNEKTKGPDDKNFIYVNWGPDFRVNFSIAFPNLEAPALSVGHGQLGLHCVLENRGAGYFPMRLVRSHINAGTLFLVKDTPIFLRPAFVVYPKERSDERFKTALQGLRFVASIENEE